MTTAADLFYCCNNDIIALEKRIKYDDFKGFPLSSYAGQPCGQNEFRFLSVEVASCTVVGMILTTFKCAVDGFD